MGTVRHLADPPPDDPLILLAFGGLAYLLTMLLHEAVGHGVGCLLAGAEPRITAVATQCEVQPLAMVLAGPLLNWAVGLCLWRALPAVSREPPQRWWLLWLLLAYNLLVAAGYLVFCGLAGFGDWAVAMSPLLPAWVWRPLEVVGGAALYYLALRATSALVPLGAASPTRPNRLRTLVLLPYIGAGLVALAGGLLNPIDPIRRFLLPAASSFGAGLGLLWVPDIHADLWAVSHLRPTGTLERVTRHAGWLAAAAVAILLFVTLIGPGLTIRR